jgi:hypothetical protein
MRNTNTNPHRLFNSATGNSPEISNQFARILSKKKSDWLNNGWENEVCAITLENIKDLVNNNKNVVLFIDGHLYEQTALLEWLRINPRSPVTQQTVGRLAETRIDVSTNQILKIVLLALGVACALNLFSFLNEFSTLTAEIQSHPCHDFNALLNCRLDQVRQLNQLLERQMTCLMKAMLHSVVTGVFLSGFLYLQLRPSNSQDRTTVVIDSNKVTMTLDQVIHHLNHSGFSRLNSPEL